MLEYLESLRKHFLCPKCHEESVDVNNGDYYECRQCHTQYTTGGYSDEWERVIIIDMDGDFNTGAIAALVMPDKGTGDFQIDSEIAKVREEMERVLKSRKKRPRRSKT
jgi:hydrogenase maturation factor HypF (carbamoyltransferase family)